MQLWSTFLTIFILTHPVNFPWLWANARFSAEHRLTLFTSVPSENRTHELRGGKRFVWPLRHRSNFSVNNCSKSSTTYWGRDTFTSHVRSTETIHCFTTPVSRPLPIHILTGHAKLYSRSIIKGYSLIFDHQQFSLFRWRIIEQIFQIDSNCCCKQSWHSRRPPR